MSAKPQLLPLDPNLLYEPEEVAQFLRMSAGTLQVWRSTGRYPALRHRKVGGKILYLGRDVLAFLDAPHQKPRPKIAKPPQRREASR